MGASAFAASAGLDRLAVRAEGCTGGDDHREHDEHCEGHADSHVDPLLPPPALGVMERDVPVAHPRLLAPVLGIAHLLDTLAALPEEEIGRDRGAEDSRDEPPVGQAGRELLEGQALPHLPPVHPRREHHRHVGEEGQAQRREHVCDDPVGTEDEKEHDDKPCDPAPEVGGPGPEQFHSAAHGHQVGREVDDVGHSKEDEEDPDGDASAAREALPHDPAEAVAGGGGRAVGHLLHGNHQRKHDWRCPDHPEAVGRPGLRVGRNAGGVVVGRARDEARPEDLGSALPPGAAGGVVRALAERSPVSRRHRGAPCGTAGRRRRG